MHTVERLLRLEFLVWVDKKTHGTWVFIASEKEGE